MAHEKNGIPQLGEISTIRDILMGQQMSDYELRFKQLEEYLRQAEQALQTKIDALSGNNAEQFTQLEEQTQKRFSTLESTINDQFNQLENATSNRFTQLEKLLSDNVDRLQQEIKHTSTSDRQRIGTLLLNIGQQLVEE
ncbi:MAG: hypothetical protein AB8G22_19865 [Saprospiraceae bacterium]